MTITRHQRKVAKQKASYFPIVIYQKVDEVNPEILDQIYVELFELVINELRQNGKPRIGTSN